VGGSDEALADLSNSTEILNVDGMVYEGDEVHFIRDKKIPRPHNDFVDLTTVEKNIVIDKNAWTNSIPESFFVFDSTVGLNGLGFSAAAEVLINFGIEPQYDVQYLYDEDLQEYRRFFGNGTAHKDRTTDGQLRAANILVQVTSYYVMDDYGRLSFTTEGEGKAFLIRDGKIFKGLWKKEGMARTRFFNESGDEFALKPGQTWVEIVGSEEDVTVN